MNFLRGVPQRGLSLQETAEALRDRIFAVVGVPTTVGIARTRTLAKLISDTAKLFGARPCSTAMPYVRCWTAPR